MASPQRIATSLNVISLKLKLMGDPAPGIRWGFTSCHLALQNFPRLCLEKTRQANVLNRIDNAVQNKSC